jgi:hypothetical protein
MSDNLISRLLGICAMGAAFMYAAGCESSYATPGRGADIAALSDQADGSIEAALDKKPLAQFPAAIAVARVESPGYRTDTAEGWGYGRYSIVTTRDIEDPGVLEAMGELPQVRGIAPINRMLLPANLQSNFELRRAAAELHADMLLIYSIDTTFDEKDLAGPLTLVTLGLAPDQKISVTSTASAALLDTRNGYVYGICEATDKSDGLTIGWQTDAAVDESRRNTEASAFKKMSGQVEQMWMKVLKERAVPPAGADARQEAGNAAPLR